MVNTGGNSPEVVAPDGRSSRRGAVRGNSLWNVASFVATSLALFATVSIAVRSLSREEFGLYSLLLTLATLLPVLDLGLRSPVTVAAARAESTEDVREEARRQFHAGLASYRVLAAISTAPWIISAAIVILADVSPDKTSALELGTATVLSGASATGVIYSASAFAIATARGAYRFMGITTVLGQLANLALVTVCVDEYGLVALSAGQFANILVSRIAIMFWVNRSTDWLQKAWRLPARAETTALGRLAGPALVLSLSAQLVAVSDALLLSALAGTAAVAAYRLGSLIPTQSLAVLYRAVDVVFPLMAASQDRRHQERLASQATEWGAVLGGTGFGVLVLLRDDAVVLLTGSTDKELALILVLFCAVWAANVPMHGWGLLILARNKQRLLAPLVLLEAAVNAAVTASLVPTLGAVGAAIGTLVAMLLCNLLLQPMRLRKEFSQDFTTSLVRRGIPLLVACAALPIGATWLSLDLSGRAAVAALLLVLQPSLFAFSRRWWGRQHVGKSGERAG